ncbi:MAG: hypothetical protein SH856_06865 [Flavobacteriales bacterium]|nr:hypothetical protein [Flavobacteriales bacterium]
MEEQATTFSPLHIVVLGKYEYILSNAEKLLQRAGFRTTGFLEKEDAAEYIRMNPVDGVLMGGGVNPHDRLELSKMLEKDFPNVKVIEHFGGPATIVEEVKKAIYD